MIKPKTRRCIARDLARQIEKLAPACTPNLDALFHDRAPNLNNREIEVFITLRPEGFEGEALQIGIVKDSPLPHRLAEALQPASEEEQDELSDALCDFLATYEVFEPWQPAELSVAGGWARGAFYKPGLPGWESVDAACLWLREQIPRALSSFDLAIEAFLAERQGAA